MTKDFYELKDQYIDGLLRFHNFYIQTVPITYIQKATTVELRTPFYEVFDFIHFSEMLDKWLDTYELNLKESVYVF